MKKYILMFLTVLFLSSFAYTQNSLENAYTVIPLNEVLPVIVFQDDSPIKIEKYIVAQNKNGAIETFYTARNTSSKTVKQYTIARWFSDNTGFVGQGILQKGENYLLPNTFVENTPANLIKNTDIEVIKPDKKLKKIAFVMVIEVVFSDGTKFDAKKIFNSLEDHLKMFETKYDSTKN